MGFFNIFKKRKPAVDHEFDEYAEKKMAEFLENDFLGKAAESGHKAQDAVKAKKYDLAWGFYHEQKTFYMQHANCSGFTAKHAETTGHPSFKFHRKLTRNHSFMT